jgi:ferritin-like metal-binding protein YciE
MTEPTVEQQLVKYLVDAHAIEEQALVQLRRAPALAGDETVAQAFAQHLRETEDHERAVREALTAHDAEPAAIKEAVMKAGGLAFVLFARSQPDTPGKLATHAYSYEHLELAGYRLLERVALLAGDQEVVELARSISDQERAMARRLAESFERTAAASLDGRDAASALPAYLADAHAIEAQSIALLERAPRIVEDDELAGVFARHLSESEQHSRLLEQRLQQLGSRPSVVKDAAMRLGALNWGSFFQAHPDTPGKLAAFAFAFEHLEIGGYEHLRCVAQAADDGDTVLLAERTIAEERAAAESIANRFDHAADASLRAVGVPVAVGA